MTPTPDVSVAETSAPPAGKAMIQRAAVVIHGIGQHQPFEMARDFAAGLAGYAGTSVTVKDCPPPLGRVYRVQLGPQVIVDVLEVYWAPLTAGITNGLSVLGWILTSTFIPSRLFGWPQVTVRRKIAYDAGYTVLFLLIALGLYYLIFGAMLETTAGVVRRLPADGVRRPAAALGPVLLNPLPALGLSGETLRHLGASWNAPVRIPLGIAGTAILGRVLAPVSVVWLLIVGVGTFLLFHAMYYLLEFLREVWGRARGTPSLRGLRGVTLAPALCLVYFYLHLIVTSPMAGTPLGRSFFGFAYVFAVFQLMTLWMRRNFVNYIGDIEVYVTRDAKSARFMARDQIRRRAMDVITAACTHPDYEEVVVFGHSLGSVIGLDAIRALLGETNGSPAPDDPYARLTSFVTFGSPLEKTRFFFDRVSPGDPGRWQDFLVELRKTLLQQNGTIARIAWTNFWYFTDIVANSLESYNDRPAGQSALVLTYPPLPCPGQCWWVHSAYLGDTNFFGPVFHRLVRGPSSTLRKQFAADPAAFKSTYTQVPPRQWLVL